MLTDFFCMFTDKFFPVFQKKKKNLSVKRRGGKNEKRKEKKG